MQKESIFEYGYKILQIDKDLEKEVVEFFKNSQEVFQKSNTVSKNQKELGIGYNCTKSLKECIQIRYGETMEYPDTCQKSFINSSKLVFSKLDVLSRKILYILFYETNKELYQKIIDSLDPNIDQIDKDGKYLSSSVLDICHYFKESKDLFCPSHTDQGLLTIVIELDKVALQVYKPRKESNYSFCLEENTKGNTSKCVVIFGEQMALISQRKILPTVHRVKNIDSDRFSLIFKLRARPDVFGPMTDSDYPILYLQKSIPKKIKKVKEGIYFPLDIFMNISFFLPLKDLLKLGLVCKDWYEAANNNSLWRYLAIAHFHVIAMNVVSWKEIYIQRFLQTRILNSSQSFVDMTRKKVPNKTVVKSCIIGDPGVGKTCMLIAHAMNKFPEDYIPTVFDEYSTSMMIDDIVISLGVWDTAGQDIYDKVRPLAYSKTDVFLIVFSVASRESMKKIETKWIPEIERYCPNTPFIIIGAKTDLRYECMSNGLDYVTTEEGTEFAKKMKAYGYFENSSKKLEGLKEFFDFTCRLGTSKNVSFIQKTDKNCLIN